jgi:hypothetical protein
VCRRGHFRYLLQQLDVLTRFVELVVAHQGAEGRAAEDAELLFVDLLEQGALVELRRALQVAEQILLEALKSCPEVLAVSVLLTR